MNTFDQNAAAESTRGEIALEQSYLTRLYDHLDGQRQLAEERLAAVLRESGETPQAQTERDATAARYEEQLVRLRAAEHGLCFGRLDFDDGERRYVGRLGIFDESNDYEPLLIDWRAPAARPFYTATAAERQQVRRRRHLRTRDRTVDDVQDEVLDLAGAEPAEVTGEAALLAALNAGRTGRMSDIVATIQAEQDRAIRADHDGVLVVEGGPGTGKTAVALHRAAYLLYQRRQELGSRGVLVVGPNPTFLRYIDQVLPSLGETGVLLATVGQLFPGVEGGVGEHPAAAEVKGRPVMADVLAAAVRDRQQLPAQVREVALTDTHAGLGYQRTIVRLDPAVCERARERARASRRPHNQAKAVFDQYLLQALAQQLADRLGEDPFADDPLGGDDAPGAGMSLLDEGDVAAIARELRSDLALRQALDELWPRLTPQRLVADLFAEPDRLASAADPLTDAERGLLHRPPDSPWTTADVPLLDEAAELLGEDEPDAAPRRREQQRRREYAQGVLDIASGSRPLDGEDGDEAELSVSELLTAEQLAERQEDRRTGTAAEQAAVDRNWRFGHVIVDEAQELSAMAWRVLMRRCPSRSMTLVGDLAQTGDPAGAAAWEAVLGPYVGQRWRRERLSVNYRTPAEIMDVAAGVAATLDPEPWLPRSVRRLGVSPWRLEFGDGELVRRLPEVVAAEAAEVADGRLAVIVPPELLPEVAEAVTGGVPGAASGADPAVLDAPVVVLPVRSAKGLEFDSVVVVEPGRILAASPHGANDLYVALTRPTRRLGVLHSGQLPGALAALTAAPTPEAGASGTPGQATAGVR